ncbi:hypothetical protein [Legionella quateirensis]|uniref:Uncharacterized protein n=1 Tax=Legionella quateirensis TaxID=45072 RepID=A0A378KSS2_9GAMM|nr:hypothetical protein [Legionella quateirensis]KTD53008.1 hypothetical protein Lqua_0841 [Legionella quateirensis]STY17229.1 Uncharacterised protein [Legionella quateirensis]
MYLLDEIKVTIKEALANHQFSDEIDFNIFCQHLMQLDAYSPENFNAFRHCVSSYSDLKKLIITAEKYDIQEEIVAFIAQMIALIQPHFGLFITEGDWFVFQRISRYLSEKQQLSVMSLLSPLALLSSLDHVFDYSRTIQSLKGEAEQEFTQRYAQALADTINTPEDCVVCLNALKSHYCINPLRSTRQYSVYHPVIVHLMSILSPKLPKLLINLDSTLAILVSLPHDSQKLVIDACFDNLILWTNAEHIDSWNLNCLPFATKYFSSLIAKKIVNQETLFSTLHFWKAKEGILENIIAIIKPQLPQLLTDSINALAFLEMVPFTIRLKYFDSVAHLITQPEECGRALALMPDRERRICLKRMNIKIATHADLQAWLAICHTYEEQTLIIRRLDKNDLPCGEAEIEAMHTKPSEFPDLLKRSIDKLREYLCTSCGYSDISIRHRNAAVAMIKILEKKTDLTRKDVILLFREECKKIQKEIWREFIRGSLLHEQLVRILDDFDDDGQECASALVEQVDCTYHEFIVR